MRSVGACEVFVCASSGCCYGQRLHTPEISRSLVEISAVKVSDFASNAEIRETENPGIH